MQSKYVPAFIFHFYLFDYIYSLFIKNTLLNNRNLKLSRQKN